MANLLLSIDRREGTAAAMETVKLAHDLASQGVVGIDLSGNPAVGQWATWEPALQEARALGLKISLHAGEVAPPSATAATVRCCEILAAASASALLTVHVPNGATWHPETYSCPILRLPQPSAGSK